SGLATVILALVHDVGVVAGVDVDGHAGAVWTDLLPEAADRADPVPRRDGVAGLLELVVYLPPGCVEQLLELWPHSIIDRVAEELAGFNRSHPRLGIRVRPAE